MHQIVRRLLILILVLWWSHPLYAQSKTLSVTNISFGTYTETYEDDQIDGTTLSISYKRFFTDQWAYFVGLGSSSAEGKHEYADGSEVDIESRRTSLNGGLKWHYYADAVPWLTPFIGAGLSIQSYSYDYDYEGSEIGSTSGTGYGPLFMIGARMDVGKHFLIIPGYQFEQIYIESESGDQVVLTSSGFMLALVLRF